MNILGFGTSRMSYFCFSSAYLASVASGADATSELLGLPPDDLGEVADHAVVGGAVERTQVGGVQVPLLQ